jgi:acyl carrier protein
MTPDDARAVVADALADIAPEVDLATLDASADFAAEADLDSMDLLSLAEAIHERTGVDFGSGDLPPRWSLTQLTDQLCAQTS